MKFHGIIFGVLGLSIATPSMANYLALGVQSGSSTLGDNSTATIARLSYDFQHNGDLGGLDTELTFGGLLTSDERIGNAVGTHLVREANVSFQQDAFSVTFGRQLILWGTADGFNPTDVITPTNFQLASYGLQDSRFGVDGLHASVYLGDAVVVSAFSIFDKPTNLLAQGFDPTNTLDADAPYRSGQNGYGLRANWQSGWGDLNLSYYQGPASTPIVTPTGSGTTTTAPEISMIGLDLDTVVGSWRLYSEMAFHHYSASTSSLSEAYLPDDEFQLAVGAERELNGANRLAFQVFQRELTTDRPVSAGATGAFSLGARQAYGQYDDSQTGASLRYSWESDDTIWSGDITYSTWFEQDSYVRVRGKYRLGDHQSIYLYGDWFDGPAGSPFGTLTDTSSVTLEYRHFF